MNLSEYTEFKNVPLNGRFIDADGFLYTKVSEAEARHEDARYVYGFVDYAYSPDDRVRVQA